ncbi:MAG: hypothetical protein RL148_513 [Planctomycetota bacterium]|jgi:ABC-type enterochelin transport system permease subunit
MKYLTLAIPILIASCVSPDTAAQIGQAVGEQIGPNAPSVVTGDDAIVLTVTEAVIAAIGAAGLGFLAGPLRAILPALVRTILALILGKKKQPEAPKVEG